MKPTRSAFLVVISLAASVCSQAKDEQATVPSETNVALATQETGQTTKVDPTASKMMKGMGPLESKLLQLHRTEFKTPEARKQAIQQWISTNSDGLKVELDARRKVEKPERDRQQAEAQVRLEKTLNDQVAAGKLGKLEGEFIKLSRASFDNPEQHSAAIKQWQTEKGAALHAETEGRRARDAPRVAALQAEALVHRKQQMDAALASGRIGRRESELVLLSQNPDLEPTARQEAVRTWLNTHGEELKAEKDARRQTISLKPVIPDAPNNSATP